MPDASAPRRRLPNRRENKTVDLVFEGQRYHVTVGFDLDGRPREVFCHGSKVGSSMDLILDDACVALSLLLQHGVDPQSLAHSMGRLGDGAAASIIGALVDLVSTFERERTK
ncbi:MAG: ribonucleotide reductase [Proteobacteria bacterium]|nr:ribonucleotide reductase [Pseudomonadota bacterium]